MALPEKSSLKKSNIECLLKKGPTKTKKKMVNSSLNTYAMQVKQNLPPYCFGLLVGTRNEQQE